MQTFLIHPDHAITAKLLDYRRLGKQRVEAKQLCNILLTYAGLSNAKAWMNHPAVKYWIRKSPSGERLRIFLPALVNYTDIMIEEWKKRGYKNTMQTDDLKEIMQKHRTKFHWDTPSFPAQVYTSHIARLLQKNTEYYSKTFAENGITIPENWETMEYFWLSEVKPLKVLTKV